jgi:chromosome partitioning protein
MGNILLFGTNKGGGGKTTVCVNVAIALVKSGYKVCVVDADKQGSFDNWHSYRKDEDVKPYLFTVSKRGKIAKELTLLKEDYDFVLVDVEGSNSVELIQALTVADICIAPHQATQPDLETMAEMQNQLDTILPVNPKLKVLCFQNQANTNPKAFAVERSIFLDFVEQFEDLTPTEAIGFSRVCYYTDWPSGFSVYETSKGANKGVKEINQLTSELLTCLQKEQ